MALELRLLTLLTLLLLVQLLLLVGVMLGLRFLDGDGTCGSLSHVLLAVFYLLLAAGCERAAFTEK